MTKTRTQIEQKCKQNIMVHDVVKWTFMCKHSKKLWAAIQWFHKHDMLTERGLDLINYGYKGHNGILKITTRDLIPIGNNIMRECYTLINDKFDKVDTILSRCSKRIK
jgi:hypothetical protein